MKQVLTFASAFCCLILGLNQANLGQEKAFRPAVSVAAESSMKDQDGLNGPVRRVRAETAQIVVKDGKLVEGPRVLRGITTYDPRGRKIDSVDYPVEGSTLPGKEQYRYDNKGNIVEMVVRDKDGSILSKESYEYAFDRLGNWIKMSSSVAVYENGKVIFEPIEVTYRTITYYYGQAIDKLAVPGLKADAALTATPATRTRAPARVAAVTSSVTDSSGGVAKEPVSRSPDSQAKSEAVNSTFSVAAVERESKPAEDGLATTVASVPLSDNTALALPGKLRVQHVDEEVLRKAAINLPKPEYPPAARAARTEGKVEVQVIIDEKGEVSSARAISGSPLLNDAAEEAARQARFLPAKLSSDATQVSGVLSYDFALPIAITPPVASTRPPVENTEIKPAKPEDSPASRASTTPTADFSAPEAMGAAEPAMSLYRKGLEHLAAGRHAEAVAALNQSIRLNPNDAIAYLKLGLAYSGLRRYNEAIVGFKMAARIKREVLDAEGYYRWGYAYSTLGKFSEAQDAFKQALYITRAQAADPDAGKAPNSPPLEEIHYSLGLSYHNAKRYNDAVRELKQAISLNPRLLEAYYGLGLAYIKLANRKSAETQLEILTALKSPLAAKLAGALEMSRVNESALRQYKVVN